MTEIIRVLRILKYVGPREQIERILTNSAVPLNGEKRWGDCSIRSAVIEQYLEILERKEEPSNDA